MHESKWGTAQLAGWCLLFACAAIVNAGGYRYGASDQAFYIPAVLHHLDAALFPRDWALFAPQDRFAVFPAAAAFLARATGLGVPALFFGLYLGGVLALFGAAVGIGSRLFRSGWTVVALAFALTLRHAVALGAVNTLEGYMHPRMIAFGLGALAVAACLGGRPGRAALFVALAAVCHPTTAMWFLLWIGVALAVADRRFTVPLLVAAAAAAIAGAWAVTMGPLAGRLAPMDDAWLAVLAQKRYLFPTRWPFGGWLPAILTPIIAAALFLARRSQRLVTPEERGVAAGAAVLLVAFLVSVPLTAAHVAFAVQLQIPRTLWLIDLLAVAYIVWYFAEGAAWARGASRAPLVTAVMFLSISLGRGAYVMIHEHPERSAVQIDLPAGEWSDAMRWIELNTDKAAWLLAPPGHAWKYGSSARVSARRDVFVEETKDSAIAMYSRAAAMTVLDRVRRSADFESLTAERARALAANGGPNILVAEQDLALPVLYKNARFRVYRID